MKTISKYCFRVKLRKQYFYIMQFRLSIILMMLFGVAAGQSSKSISIQLLQARNLALSGAAGSINFTCCYEGSTNQKSYTMHPKAEGDYQNECIRIRVKDLDCGGSGINRDLYKSLQADIYPYVEIEPIHTNLTFTSEKGSTQDIWIETRITIAGTSKVQYIHLSAQPLGDNSYNLVGSHKIKMSSYGLEAPRPVFGLVKVNDDIILEFDIVVTILR